MIEQDIQLFRQINGLAGQSQALDWFGVFAAQWLIWLMVAALLVIAAIPLWRRRRGVCLICHALPKPSRRRLAPELSAAFAAGAALLAMAMAWFGNQLFSWVGFWRQRPFVTLSDIHQLIAEPLTGKSFPSDHSTIAFAIALSLTLARPRWGWAFLPAAAIVAWGRVFVGVHYPADVLAGAVVGCLWALLARWLEKRSGLTVGLCQAYEKICHRLSGR